MPVEDHPRYHEWREASDRLSEAKQRHLDALGKPHASAAKLDLAAAQKAYDRISTAIDND